MVEQAFALRYPNGRVHECTLKLEHPLQPGSEFELHGHNWRVQQLLPADRLTPSLRWLCTALDAKPSS